MAKRRLWGHVKSINVQKVLWALSELGLDYERVDAGGTFGKVRDSDYLSLNPNGLVPTLEDGTAVLWESNAIVRYLFAKYGASPVQPIDLAARARADAWADWNTTTLWPHVRTLVVQLVRTPEDKRDRAAINTALQASQAALTILDRELAKQPYVAGAHFTWGDIPVGAAVQRWTNLPLSKPSFGAVQAWYERLKTRPSFEQFVDLPLT
jgi:glutathione S-transferase